VDLHHTGLGEDRSDGRLRIAPTGGSSLIAGSLIVARRASVKRCASRTGTCNLGPHAWSVERTVSKPCTSDP
jgi:hypothetical protein